MRRAVSYALILFVCFIAQTSFPRIGLIFSASPDLLLIATVCAGYLGGRRCGMAAGFFAGLMTDLYQGQMAGFYALLFVLAGYAAGTFYQIYFESSARMPAVIVFVCDAACGFATYAVRFFLRGRIGFAGYLRNVILPEAVVTMLFTVVVYHLIYLAKEKFIRKGKGRKAVTWLKG